LPADGGFGDGGLLSPCESGAYVFYADAKGGYGTVPDGPTMLTGTEGTWSAGLNGGLFELVVSAGAEWAVSAMTSQNEGPFQIGTYTIDPGLGPWIQVEVAGGVCTGTSGPTVPTGTFTVAEVATDGSKVLLGFDLACNGVGTLRGCVSYGNPGSL
jgi:hypothetical protein